MLLDLLLLLLLLFRSLLSQPFLPGTTTLERMVDSPPPTHSDFKFQTRIFSVLRVVFQLQLSVANLLSVFLVWLLNFSLNLCFYYGGSSYYWCNYKFRDPHLLHLITWTLTVYFLFCFFCFTFLFVGIATSIYMRVFSYFIYYFYYTWPICH